jgi:CBS domain-containing protein
MGDEQCKPRRTGRRYVFSTSYGRVHAAVSQKLRSADILTALSFTSRFLFPLWSETHMLDAFKSMTGGKSKLVQKQTDELELLISTAREERSAISAMLTALTTRSAKLAPLGKTLDQVSEKAAGVTSRLEEITKRLTTLDDRTKELSELDKRIQTLKEAAKQAEQTTQKALGPDGELQKHREAVQHLTRALDLLATLPASPERDTIELSLLLPLGVAWMAVQGYAAQENPVRFSDPVRTAMTQRIDTVSLKTPLSQLTDLLNKGHVAIVVDKGQFYGLITRMDVLNHLRNRAP